MSWIGVNFPDVLRKDPYADEEDPNDMNLHTVDLEHRQEHGEHPTNAAGAVSVGDVGQPSQRFRHIKNRKYMRRLYIALAALACIFIFSSMVRLSTKQSGKSDNDNTSNAITGSGKDLDLSGASSRLSQLLTFLHENAEDSSETADLENASSSQRLAAEWMADSDALQLEIPETRFDEVYHPFIQRYSTVVLAFAWGVNKLLPLGFLSDEHECNWNADFQRPDTSILKQGIICEKKQVVKIVLQTLGLSGSIPREIGHFRAVQHMHLDGNELTGRLPQMMHRMQSLSELTMTRNLFSGQLPSFMAQMASLRHIEISKNLFSGELAKTFGGMKVPGEETGDTAVDITVSPIHVLAIDNNLFHGPLHALSSMTLLEELFVNNNDFTGHIADTFVNTSQLAILLAGENKLSGKVPDKLLELPSLSIVDLHSNQFGDSHPHGNSSVLKYLDLSDNLIEGPVPRSIGQHRNLAYLDLSRNRLTELPPTFGKLKNLQFLFLSHNPTLEAGILPEWLLELNVLSSVSFKNTARIGNLPEWLGHLSQLTMLDLELNSFNSSIPISIAGMESMEFLFLNRNELTGGVPDAIGNLTNLKLLNVDHNSLTGLVPGSVCAHDFEVFIADCYIGNDTQPLIECACCTKCCKTTVDACNTRDWSTEYGDDWGNYFQRYNIIEDGDVYELVDNVEDDRNNDGN